MTESPAKGSPIMSADAAKDLAASLRSDTSTITELHKPVIQEQPEPDPAPAKPAAKAEAPVKDEAEDLSGIEVIQHKNRQVVPTDVLVGERRKLNAKLKAEREAREKFEAEANQRLKDMAESFAKGAGKAEPEKKPEAKADPETNPFNFDSHPFEHLKWKADKAEERAAAVERKFGDNQNQTQQERELMATVQTYQAGHQAFTKTNPHYQGAYDKVMNTWVSEAKAAGLSDQDAIRAANQREWAVIQMAKQANASPQERMLAIAGAIGWTAPKGDGLDTSKDGQDAAARAQKEKEDLQRLKEAGEVSGSLSDLTGGAAPPELTLKTIMAMPQGEWREWMANKDNKKKFDQLLRKAG